MKKTIIAVLLAALVLLLAGCTESEILCGVNTKNQAYLLYDLNADLSALDEDERQSARLWVWDLAYRMQEDFGFAVDTNADSEDDEIHLRAQLTRQGKDEADAVTQLRAMITDEQLSPFTAAQVEASAQAQTESFRLDLRFEPGRILDTAGTEQMPKLLREKLRTWFDEASVTLRITLPATDLPAGEEAELKGTIAEKSLQIPATGSGELSLSTLVYHGDKANDQVWWGGEARTAGTAADMMELVSRDAGQMKLFRIILEIAAGVLLVLAIGLFTWGTLRKKKIK